MLKRRKLGKSGIEVGEIGLGLWASGGDSWGPTDDQESLDAIDAALDLEANFFDTADIYNDGRSEQLLGKAMHGRRDMFVVATKIGLRNFDHTHYRSVYDTAEKVVAGVESSLRRLQTDYVDIIQSHIKLPDPTLKPFLEGFQSLQRDGKVRAYGLSTSHFDHLKTFNANGGCATLQIDFSLLNRMAETNIFPYCQENNIGVIVRGPLAMGILTEKFNPRTRFRESDWRRRWTENAEEKEVLHADLKIVEQLKPLTNGRSMAQLALQFVLANPAVTVVIPGGKTATQVKENMISSRMDSLSVDALAKLDQIIPKGGGRKIWPA